MFWRKGINTIQRKENVLINMKVVHIHGFLDKDFGNVEITIGLIVFHKTLGLITIEEG